MKKAVKLTMAAMSSVLALALFAGCGEKPADNGGNNPPSAEGGVEFYARICYDNLNAENSYLNENDTKVTLPEAATALSAKDASGESVAVGEVASYDAGTKTFTAVSAGTVDFTIGSAACRIEVVPAYVTNPGNAYTGTSTDTNELNSQQLGFTHDPSFIETEEEGKTVYYLFSTGWNNRSQLDGVNTYGNAIHRSEDGMATWQFAGRTFDLSTRNEDFVNSEAGEWLYKGGTLGSYNASSASWWAPDIVRAPDGGYWLYTCVVDGSDGDDGLLINGAKYARACCLLYHADDIYQGAFEYVGVLMQSSIRRKETMRDVNGIDPQILYTPDGKMYMAYGSFGSGNWMIELDPQTGLRKDGKGWQTHEEIRNYVENDVQDFYNNTRLGESHEYYGTYISKGDMEAPVLARHDNVKIADETATYDEAGAPLSVEGKTYYYSMHSYNGLSSGYMMWGGRSENITGVYKSATGAGNVVNTSEHTYPQMNGPNEGNKYMGAFKWSNKVSGSKEIDVILTGHNDLFTTKYGHHLAAYITRTPSYTSAASSTFLVQVHQYYLNSMGDICINPNRYGKEIDRSVSQEELLHYTDSGKFQMVAFANKKDTGSSFSNISNVSREVVLTEDGKVKNGSAVIGSYLMYGKGYIKFTFTDTSLTNGETVFYGVVRPAWLGNLNKSGFTITCLSHTPDSKRSMAMFMNAQSTITGEGLVG